MNEKVRRFLLVLFVWCVRGDLLLLVVKGFCVYTACDFSNNNQYEMRRDEIKRDDKG